MEKDNVRGTVQCDSDCGAFAYPETLEEYKNTLEHWENHGVRSGCAHGY